MVKLGFVAAVVIGVLASAADAAVLPRLDPVAIDAHAKTMSEATPAAISFDNLLPYAVDVFWIDGAGNRVFGHTVAANYYYTENTFLTQPWLAVVAGSGDTTAQGTGTLIAGFRPVTPSSYGYGPDIAYIGAVPEPASWALLVTGFALTGLVVRRRGAAASGARSLELS